MGNRLNAIAHFVTQILFSLITPPLLIPWIAKWSITRFLILFCFGRLYGDRYEDIIDSFQGRYGLAMAEGLANARKGIGDRTPVVVDCGTGTGFVTRLAAEHLPNATFVAFDMLYGMVTQARNNCKGSATHALFLQADTFALPLADQSIDLLLAQNTIPWFREFSRVCRPDGIILYVDTSAGWITSLGRWLVSRSGLFESVKGERVDLGFYILAKPKSAV